MRYNKLILPLVLSLFVLPLTVAGSKAAAEGQPDARGFRILFADGSVLAGAVSFTMDLDTQYGRMTVPSTNFLSAHFNSTDGWANIWTKGIQLRVQYKAASSDLKATTDVGPVNVDLTKVVSVETLYAQVPNPAATVASNPSDQGQPPVAPTDIYADNSATVPETSSYDYASTVPVYANPVYVAPTYGYPYGDFYGYPYGYSYVWCPGYGFIAARNFNRNYYGHHDGFGGRHDGFGGQFHNAAAGRGFSSRSFRGTASPGFRSAASSFHSAAASTFRSGATRSFGGGGSSFRSGGMHSGSAGGRSR